MIRFTGIIKYSNPSIYSIVSATGVHTASIKPSLNLSQYLTCRNFSDKPKAKVLTEKEKAERLARAEANRAKKSKSGGDDEDDSTSAVDRANIFWQSSERVKRRRHKFPPEVAERHQRVGKEYNRQMMVLNNMYKRDIAIKEWLMEDAFKALPLHLQEHAQSDDDLVLPPEGRHLPLWDTPPVKGFKMSDIERAANIEATKQEDAELNLKDYEK
jgi:hypothetical protein